MEQAKAAGEPVWEMPTVDPEHLADLLWTMHSTKGHRKPFMRSIACRRGNIENLST